MRSHLYTTLNDENGVIYSWASLRIYDATGTKLYAGPIYVDDISPTLHTNPYVIAPATVDFYLGEATTVVLGITTGQGVKEILTSPLDITPDVDSIVTAPSSLVIPGNPIGTSVLRAADGSTTTWFQPGLAPHDHHGSASLSTRVAPEGYLPTEVESFPSALLIGDQTRLLPQYHYAYSGLAVRNRIWGNFEGHDWLEWTGIVIPSGSTNLTATVGVGVDAVALGRGVVALGNLAYAADDNPVPSIPGGIAAGARAVSDSGSISFGYAAGGALPQVIAEGNERRITLGAFSAGLGQDAVVIGTAAEAGEHGVSLGAATTSPDSGLAIGYFFANDTVVSLPSADTIVAGDLHSQASTSVGATGFFGAELDSLPSWNGLEPASGIPALDNLVYALRDLGLLAPPGQQPSGTIPSNWVPDVLEYLSTLQDGGDPLAPRIGIDNLNFVRPGFVTGTVVFSSDVQVNTIPSMLIANPQSNTPGYITGTWNSIRDADTNLNHYRVDVHVLNNPAQTPSTQTRMGLFALNSSGTWTSAPVYVNRKGYRLALFCDEEFNVLPARLQASQATYDAQVVVLVDGERIDAVPLWMDDTFFAYLDSWGDYEFQLRAITDDTLLATTRRADLFSTNITETSMAALVFAQQRDTAFRAREIFYKLATVQQSDGSLTGATTIADYAWLGMALRQYALTTSSTEFADMATKLVTFLTAQQRASGSIGLSTSPALTADNVLAYLFLHGQGVPAATDLGNSLQTKHLLSNGYFASSITDGASGTYSVDATPNVWADIWGSWFLLDRNRADLAEVSLRQLSAFRVLGQHISSGYSVTGYSLGSYPAGTFSASATAAATMVRLRADLSAGTDIQSLDRWRTEGVDFAENSSSTDSSITVAAWYALVAFETASNPSGDYTLAGYPSSSLFPSFDLYPGGY